jgi:hypothetical protein
MVPPGNAPMKRACGGSLLQAIAMPK